MGYYKDLFQIAQNAIAQGGMDVDLHAEIAKSMSLVNRMNSQTQMDAMNPLPVASVDTPESTIAPEMGQSMPEEQITV
jgi:hypothetical protein